MLLVFNFTYNCVDLKTKISTEQFKDNTTDVHHDFLP